VGLHRENERRAAPCRAERSEEMRRKHTPLTPLPTIAGTTRVNSGPTTVGRGGMGKGKTGLDEGGRDGGETERERKRASERERKRDRERQREKRNVLERVGREERERRTGGEGEREGGGWRKGGDKGDISRVRRAKCVSVVTSGIRGGAVPGPRDEARRRGVMRTCVHMDMRVCVYVRMSACTVLAYVHARARVSYTRRAR
jgi:hypothetical protein